MSDLSEKLIAWLQGLRISTGAKTGEKFEVLKWQEKAIRGTFRPTVSQAAISTARGNGKSNFIAGIATACYLPGGPLVVPAGEVICIASSFTQSRIMFDAALAFSRPWIEKEPARYRIQDSLNKAEIQDRETRAKIRCIGSDPKRAHGIVGGIFFICDEVAQWPESITDKMRSSLVTAQGKQPGSRLLAIGTLPSYRDNWFSKMLEGNVPGTYRQLHRVKEGPGVNIYSRRTWAKANPSLSKFPDLLAAIKIEAKRAQKDPAELQTFRALRLNEGLTDSLTDYLLDPETWTEAEGDAGAVGECVWGVDTGGTRSFTAIACSWLETGRLEVIAAVGDNPPLDERATNDNCPETFYLRMKERGELYVLPGRVINLADFIDIALERFGQPRLGLVVDSWREAELKDAASSSDLLPCQITKRRQAWKDQGEDIRYFRRAVLDGSCVPVKSLLLRNALREARVIKDEGGNEKVSKSKRSRGRDDAIVAAIRAVSVTKRLMDRAGDSRKNKLRLIPLEMSL